MSATAAAQKLGIRRDWAAYAVWPEDGIVRYLLTYPSIRFGHYLNESVQISTSNKLFYRDGEMYTLQREDLNWFFAKTRTRVDANEPFHCMAHTRIEVFLTPSMLVTPRAFEEEFDDYAHGLHKDLMEALRNGEMEIYVLPNHSLDHDEPTTKRSFDLYRLINVWRKRLLSNQVSGFDVPENKSYRLLFGATGHSQNDGGVTMSSLFFAQRFLDGEKGWIVFISVELFEQLLLTWEDHMTSEVLLRHLDHCGLIIPHETSSNSVRP